MAAAAAAAAEKWDRGHMVLFVYSEAPLMVSFLW